jgi:hypothetical protein
MLHEPPPHVIALQALPAVHSISDVCALAVMVPLHAAPALQEI